MATYCYQCAKHRFVSDEHGIEVCPCGLPASRDYPAEGVGFTGLAEMKRQREQGLDGLSGRSAQRDLFLPTADELRTPNDPTGQKGIREWAEKHEPRPSNDKPLWPAMEKKVY